MIIFIYCLFGERPPPFILRLCSSYIFNLNCPSNEIMFVRGQQFPLFFSFKYLLLVNKMLATCVDPHLNKCTDSCNKKIQEPPRQMLSNVTCCRSTLCFPHWNTQHIRFSFLSQKPHKGREHDYSGLHPQSLTQCLAQNRHVIKMC